MKRRCLDPGDKSYPDYGGRGIKVCERWLQSVENFVADIGRKPSPKHELDRKDNDKGYHLENCHWTTRTENARNKRSNRWVDFQGQRMVMAAAIELSGVSMATVYKRLENGWSEREALTTPVQHVSPKGEGLRAKRLPLVNKTGFRGVCKHAHGSTFFATKMVKGVRLYIWGFLTAEEAHQAYIKLGESDAQRIVG